MSISDTVSVQVLANDDFKTDIFSDSGDPLGPFALASDRAVINGDMVTTILEVSNNNGNIPMTFEVDAFSSLNTWPIQIVHGDEESMDAISVDILSGQVAVFQINTLVPMAYPNGRLKYNHYKSDTNRRRSYFQCDKASCNGNGRTRYLW